MIDAKETRNKYIEVMERDARLGICAIEEARERVYRERGSDYEDVRFPFVIFFLLENQCSDTTVG